ncbi:MAG: discoidin domain-containing protein [Clostridia bacterium]|nr:discoidin domain-containing protein [Clostridia bacterium]
MKNLFLKRVLPIVLCLIMVIPAFSVNIFAANESLTGVPGDRSLIGTERQNWAVNGSGYHTSVWNGDRHSKYLNNGTYNHSYQWWEPSDPNRANGAGVDPTKQHFGFSFDDGYYLLDEIMIYCHTFDKGFNNIKYRVEALILGEWVEVGVAYQDDSISAADVTDNKDVVRVVVPLSFYRCSECDMAVGATWDKCQVQVGEKKNETTGEMEPIYEGCGASKSKFVPVTFKRCTACQTILGEDDTSCTKCGAGAEKIEEKFDINTNNIRVWCSEYGCYAKRPAVNCNIAECNALGYHVYEKCPKAPTRHDWWYTPKIQEVEMYGYTGYRPEFDVPMNAYLVRNAALSGMIGADTSTNMRYPGLAGDNDLASSWKAGRTGKQNIWAEFNDEYSISTVGASFGGMDDDDVGVVITYNIKLLLSGTIEDGVWEVIASDQTVTTTKDANDVSFELSKPIAAKGMMIEMTSVKNASTGRNGRAAVAELLAEIADGGKCIFLADYITSQKKFSTASGNLACFGTAYASSNFSYAAISKIANIIDGRISYSDDAWIAANYLKDAYAGVTLKEAHNVTKVALYFNDVLGGENGSSTFKIDVQAKIDGEFKTIAQITSYDAKNKSYVVAVELENPVYTDDIRIVYKSDAQTLPYLKELEVFEKDFIYSSYVGFDLDISRKEGGPAATEEFGYRSVAQRGKYFDKQSPIQYFNIALDHDVQIDWLG